MFPSLLLAAATLVSMAGGASAETSSDDSAFAHPVVRASTREPLLSEAVARAAIEAHGYTNVKNLNRDPVGNWAAEAVRGGVEIAVILQLNGEVAEE